MSRKKLIKLDFLLVWKRPIFLLCLALMLTLSMLIKKEPVPHTEIPAALLDMSQDGLSCSVWEELSGNELLRIVNKKEDADLKKYKNSLLLGDIEAVYVIEPGFEERLEAGDYKKCMSVYYGENQVAARLLTESVSSSVMKLCLRQRSMDILRETYKNAGLEFTDILSAEAGEYLDGLENAAVPMKFTYIGGEEDSSMTFRNVVIRCILLTLMSLALVISSSFLLRHQEGGVLLRLKSLGHSPALHIFVCLMSAALGLWTVVIPSSVAGAGVQNVIADILGNLLFLLWLSLFMCLVMLLIKRVFLLLMPVVIMSLTLLAGISVYGGDGMFWAAARLLNPFACALSGGAVMLSVLALHSLVLAGMLKYIDK